MAANFKSPISPSNAFAPRPVNDSPLLLEDATYDNDFETRVESVLTEDGVELKLKRYVSEGAQPVLLVHGFFANGYCFDLPHQNHNMALYLAERGYDVWVASFRGCGREPYRCIGIIPSTTSPPLMPPRLSKASAAQPESARSG